MKFKEIIFLVIAVFILLLSCNTEKVFHEVKKFDDYKWRREDKAVFSFDLQDTTVNYEMVLNIRYIQGFPFKFLPLTIEITAPSGETLELEDNIQIIKDDHSYIGDGAGSYWDLDYTVPDYPFHEKGVYKIVIQHALSEEILSPFNEIGVSIYKKNIDK